MCQYSLGDTEIAGGAEVQCLGLAEYTAENEKQWGCVGGLEGETDLKSQARSAVGVSVWGAVKLTEETKGGVWQ